MAQSLMRTTPRGKAPLGLTLLRRSGLHSAAVQAKSLVVSWGYWPQHFTEHKSFDLTLNGTKYAQVRTSLVRYSIHEGVLYSADMSNDETDVSVLSISQKMLIVTSDNSSLVEARKENFGSGIHPLHGRILRESVQFNRDFGHEQLWSAQRHAQKERKDKVYYWLLQR